MSSIQYDASLNTDKFETSIRQSTKTVNDWVKDVEKAGDKADKSFSKLGDTLKNQVSGAFQKDVRKSVGLIADLEHSLDELKEKKRNAFTIEEIEKYNRKIQEAELHLKEYNSAGREVVENHEKQEKSQNKIIDSLKRWGIGLLSITGAIKLYKEIVASSNATTEQFQFTVEGVKGAMQQLAQSLIPAAGQTGNVVKNMIEGFKNSKLLAEAVDAYNDALRSNKILTAEEIKSLESLETTWRNASFAIDERKKALDEWIVIKKGAAERELKIEQDLNAALLTEIKSRPNLKGITEEQIKLYSTIFATYPEVTKKLGEIDALIAKTGGVGQPAVDAYNKLIAELKELLPIGMQFDDVMSAWRLNSSLNKDQINALSDSFSRLAEAEAGSTKVESDVARWMGSLINKGEKAAKEINDLNNQIDVLKEKLLTAGDSERKVIADRILALEKELDIRKKIVEQALAVAWFQELGVPSKVQTTFKTPSVLPSVKPKQMSWQELRESMGKLSPNKAPDYTEAETKRLKKVNELEQKRRDLIVSVLDYSTEMTSILEEQGIMTKEAADQMKTMSEVVYRLASGDLIGSAMAVIGNIIVNLQRAFPSVMQRESERLQSKIEEINKLLEKQERILSQSERKGGQTEAQQGIVDLNQQQIDANNAAIERYQKIIGQWWRSSKTKNEAVEAILKLREENEKLQVELEDSRQALDDLFTGGITENEIADVIATGIIDGSKTGAEAMEGMMKGALTEIFKKEILGEQITATTQYLRDALKDNVFTDAERAEFERQVSEATENNREAWNQLSQAFDFNGPQPGLSGAISRQITEETGSELAGLFRRFADDERAVRDYTKSGVDHLIRIEQNTYGSWQELKSAVIELKAINTNTKPVMSGAL